MPPCEKSESYSSGCPQMATISDYYPVLHSCSWMPFHTLFCTLDTHDTFVLLSEVWLWALTLSHIFSHRLKWAVRVVVRCVSACVVGQWMKHQQYQIRGQTWAASLISFSNRLHFGGFLTPLIKFPIQPIPLEFLPGRLCPDHTYTQNNWPVD